MSPAALADPNAPLDPGPGNEFYTEGQINVRPTEPLRVSLTWTKDRLTRQDTGLVAFDQNLVSLRATYQFSPFTFVRARFDYDTLSARTYGQYLFGWTPSPGTAFYVGYNDEVARNGYSPYTGAYESGARLYGRTFFVKLSYLIRRSM